MSVIADPPPPAPLARSRAADIAVLEAEPVAGAEWDRTVATFDEVCQEQLHAFSALRWPGTRQEPILFRRAGDVVGGALVLVQKLPLGLGAMAITKWGPMLADAGDPDGAAIHAGMVEALIARFAEREGMMLSILPRASVVPGNARFDRLLARGFRPGSTLLFPDRYMVDVRLDPAAQRKSLEQKWRYHLNRSEKAGLTFEHAGRARMSEFHALYAAMTGRKQFQDHSAYSTLDALMEMEPASLRPELFFVHAEGEAVAGAVIFTAGERAVYLYGATSERALPLRAGYFLHWQIIAWLRANTRARWYDLGGTDGYRGLHQFKKGMAGSTGAVQPVPPVANYAASPFAYALGAGAFAARDGLNALKRTVGGWRNPKARPDLPVPRGERG